MPIYTPEMPKLNDPDLIGFASTYPSGTLIAPHSHPAHQIIHAISGAMRVSSQGLLWVLPVGRALWIPAGTDHAIRCNGNVRMRTAYLSPAYRDVPRSVQLISVSPLAREILIRLAETEDTCLRKTMGDLLLHDVVRGQIEPLHLPIPTDPRIGKLAAALQANPASNRGIADWARQLGFSERTLIRRIRAETGLTFRELRRQSRIHSAIEKLASGDSVTNVALDVGFDTPSAFIHAFRLITGKTPRQFLTD